MSEPIRQSFKLTCRVLFLLIFFLPNFLSAQKGDFQSGDLSVYEVPKAYKKIEERSFYIKMRDGVELACDLLIPANLPKGTKIPTILHQTRYWRGAKLRWPLSMFSPPGCPGLNPLASSKDIVKAGYAMLSVDARGSGASFGHEIMAMGPDEIADGQELMDWIVAQEWSDGQVGAIGISYNGWAAQMLATSGHPALKAIFAINSPFDGYDDMAVPGGVLNRSLVNRWSQILQKCDRGEIISSQKFVKYIVKGPTEVDGRPGALDSALVEHRKNGYADKVLKNIVGRDDQVPSFGARKIDDFFPSGYQQQLAESTIPVYAMSGWFDMAGPHAAVRILHNYGGENNKLIIGPWNHFLARNVSAFAPGKTQFEHISEVMKFFDYHLKGKATGLDQEAAVHYYTIGEEKWKSAAQWPPVAVQAQGWFLASDGQLAPDQTVASGQATLVVDTTIGTGTQTRWDLSAQNHSTYPYLDTLQAHWLTFTTAPMSEDMEITGHPALRLFLGETAPDAAVFAYLEDISPDGTIRMITDGHLQIRHKRMTPAPLYADVVPARSFLHADLVSTSKTPLQQVDFDLLPCSWRLKKGHRLRLALSGADRDHFKPSQHPQNIPVYWGVKRASHLILPLIPLNN